LGFVYNTRLIKVFNLRVGATSLQKRLILEKYYRTPEVFNKKKGGEVENRFYAEILSIHALFKCKKCSAPNYFVHEFWTPMKNSDDEARKFIRGIETTGSYTEEKLFGAYHYPNFNKQKAPEWTKDLPEKIMLLMWEVYSSFNAALPALCAMGIRAVIDIYAVSKVGDIGGFKNKLSTLKRNGHLSDSQHSALEAITEVGNASAHRGFRPTKLQVEAGLAALEAIFFFELQENKFKELKSSIPPRI